MIKLILFGLLTLSLICWILYFVLIFYNYHKTPNLSNYLKKKIINDRPLISIIIPTRNEVNRISKCIQTLKSQTYSNLEIIIVDDSIDNTIDIIKSIAENDNRFKIIKQEKLPDGWIGKPFALQQGSKIARGEWLLFIDADTYYDPVIIERAIDYVLENNLDMLSLLPRYICKSFWENIIQPIFLAAILAATPLKKVNNPKSKVSAAGGWFIIIKHSIFNKVRGYETIKGGIADDTELAQLVKTSGFKIGYINAQSLMNIRMYEKFSEIWEGWSKNSFLGSIQKRKIKSKFIQILLFLSILFAYFDLLVLPFYSMINLLLIFLFTKSLPLMNLLIYASLSWFLSILVVFFVQRVYCIGRARYSPLVTIFGGIIVMGIFINSALKTISGKGVTWRGKLYSVKR